MDCLHDETNKVMAMVIIQSIMKNNTCISTADEVKYSYLFKSHTLFFENMVTFAVFLILDWGVVWIIKRTDKGFGWDCCRWGACWKFLQYEFHVVDTWLHYEFHFRKMWMVTILLIGCFLTLPWSANINSSTRRISMKNKILSLALYICFIMMIRRKCWR